MKPSIAHARRESTMSALRKLAVAQQPLRRGQLFQGAPGGVTWQIAIMNRLVGSGCVERTGSSPFHAQYKVVLGGGLAKLDALLTDDIRLNQLVWPHLAGAPLDPGAPLPELDVNVVSRRIRQIRLARGWTQAQLATQAGLHEKRISRAELGDIPASTQGVILRAIATGLEVPVEHLLSETGPEPAAPEPEPAPAPAPEPAGFDFDAVAPAHRERVLWQMMTYILATTHDVRTRLERLEPRIEELLNAWK